MHRRRVTFSVDVVLNGMCLFFNCSLIRTLPVTSCHLTVPLRHAARDVCVAMRRLRSRVLSDGVRILHLVTSLGTAGAVTWSARVCVGVHKTMYYVRCSPSDTVAAPGGRVCTTESCVTIVPVCRTCKRVFTAARLSAVLAIYLMAEVSLQSVTIRVSMGWLPL